MGVQMKVDYEGNLRCNLTHGPSGSTLQTDAPTDNAGRGEAFSPTDLLGAALASCALTTMGIKAAKEGIPFPAGSGQVEKTMSSEGPRRVRRLDLAFELPSSLSAPHRARLEEIALTCPVALSLSPDIEVKMRFTYAG